MLNGSLKATGGVPVIEIASLSRRGRALLLGVSSSILALNIVACGGGGGSGSGGGDGPHRL